MKVIKPGLAYELDDGPVVVWKHRDERFPGGVLVAGVTTEDVIDMLIHRIASVNRDEGYCVENIETLLDLHRAKAAQERRGT